VSASSDFGVDLAGFVDIPGMSITATAPADATLAMITFTSEAAMRTAWETGFVRFRVDGAAPTGGNDMSGAAFHQGSDYLYNTVTSMTTVAITPGTHTFSVQASTPSMLLGDRNFTVVFLQ
jgi:hypothetical protein